GRNSESAARWNQWRDGQIAKCRAAKAKPPGPPSNVAKICDGYARQAVQQNRQNTKLGCGLSGPQWNSDYRYHYNWCVHGRNSESAARWNQWRDGQIAKCRTAKAEKPTALTGKPSKWDQTVLARMPDLVRYLDQKTGLQAKNIAGAQAQWEQRQADALRKAIALKRPAVDAENIRRIDEAAAEFKRRPGTVPPQIPVSALQPRPPQITAFWVVPHNDLVEPNSAILIGGLNFTNQPKRNQPGKVHLSYSDPPPELSRQVKTYNVEMLPLKETWPDSWTETLIFVRVPNTLPGERFYTDRPGKVVITFADGVSIARHVTVSGGNPVITSVTTSSGDVQGCCQTVIREEWKRLQGTTSYVLWPVEVQQPEATDTVYGRDRHWVQPGDTVTIIGRFFGDTPGKAHLTLSTGIGARMTVQLATVKPEDWSDTKITLRAEDFPISGYVEMQKATLVLQTASGRELAYNQFAFGPDYEVKRVSGIQWLEKSQKQYAQVTPNGTAMLVTHKPDCGGRSDSGEKGWDRFFADVPFPTDVKVVRFDFQQIDPENPYGDFDFFCDMMGDLADELLDYGPAGLITYGVKKGLEAIGLAGEGGYHACVAAEPGGMTWVGGNKIITVHWETSCELAEGKPVMYSTSFVVKAPK
ncbi:MAG: hypothetical protein JXM70_05200, partial [Pirellulales bacterium]|nr:hypothetical protein [Pirellulales bacterium]